MKKFIAPQILFLTIVLSLFTSCEKEKDNTPPKTKTELITQGSWKFSSATWGGSDAGPLLQTCQKDNTMIFVASGSGTGTGTLNEGATKCNSSDPQTTPFTWNFQTNETILFVSTSLFTGGSNNFTLVSVTESQLILSQMLTLGTTTQNAVVTFIH